MVEAGVGGDPAAGQQGELGRQAGEAFHGVEPGAIGSSADRIHTGVDVERAQCRGAGSDVVQPKLEVVVEVDQRITHGSPFHCLCKVRAERKQVDKTRL
jgi:hypothetical protein